MNDLVASYRQTSMVSSTIECCPTSFRWLVIRAYFVYVTMLKKSPQDVHDVAPFIEEDTHEISRTSLHAVSFNIECLDIVSDLRLPGPKKDWVAVPGTLCSVCLNTLHSLLAASHLKRSRSYHDAGDNARHAALVAVCILQRLWRGIWDEAPG